MANSIQDINGNNSATGAYNVLQFGWTANGAGSQATQAAPIVTTGNANHE